MSTNAAVRLILAKTAMPVISKHQAMYGLILLRACDKPDILGKEVINLSTIYKGYDNLYIAKYFPLISTYL